MQQKDHSGTNNATKRWYYWRFNKKTGPPVAPRRPRMQMEYDNRRVYDFNLISEGLLCCWMRFFYQTGFLEVLTWLWLCKKEEGVICCWIAVKNRADFVVHGVFFCAVKNG